MKLVESDGIFTTSGDLETSNLLELLPRGCPNVFVMEGAALMKSTHPQLGHTLPLAVVMKLVDSDGIFITSGDLETSNLLGLLPWELSRHL